jgi:hypothetical protein
VVPDLPGGRVHHRLLADQPDRSGAATGPPFRGLDTDRPRTSQDGPADPADPLPAAVAVAVGLVVAVVVGMASGLRDELQRRLVHRQRRLGRCLACHRGRCVGRVG